MKPIRPTKSREITWHYTGDGKNTVTVITTTARLKLTRFRGSDNYDDVLPESLQNFIIVTNIVTNNVTQYFYRHFLPYINRFF